MKTYGPVLKKNDDGSYSAVMVETPYGGWIQRNDVSPNAEPVETVLQKQ